MSRTGPLIGILGGMGPLATADFMARLAMLAHAECDQDHCRTLVYSDPGIPDRSEALLGRGPSPLPDMIDAVLHLQRCGADVIAIPCNTAHFWLDELVQAARVPILGIIDAVNAELARRCIHGRPVGVLGTEGMIASGVYQRSLSGARYDVVLPCEATMAARVEPAIRAVKAGDIGAARPLVLDAIADLRARGVEAIVLGCTELPVAVPEDAAPCGTPLIDSTRCLALACLAWAAGRRAGRRPSEVA